MNFEASKSKLCNWSSLTSLSFTRPVVMVIALVFLAGCASSGSNRSTGEFVDDVAMSTRIKSALLADRDTNGLEIEVEVFRGQVQLIGFTDSQAGINRALEIARNTNGVTSVSNSLRVVEDSRRVGEYIDDTVLVARITTALTSDPTTDKINIEVEANRGIVILGGFVDSSLERNTAEQITENVDGVERVINGLDVR